ncbi:MAG: ATP-binding protein [Sphingobacteriales bacterium]|nr:MAG: ATP-binding protein [Sphingobacteriales bacterium]
MPAVIGRKEEQQLLLDVLKSRSAGLVAVYGRRRVGKTYLIRNVYADRMVFELTGMYGAPLRDQLLQFSRSMQKATGSKLALKPPDSWAEAFGALEQFLESQSKRKKLVVFLDEFPWLDGRKSGFLSAFEHFWNSWASKQQHIVVAVCGSAASWMIRNLVNSKGGLHQRITQKIRLLPFTIAETEMYIRSLGSSIDRYQVLQLYMALGGIPEYLNHIRKGESASTIIQKICFAKDGLLTGEFSNLYNSLFEKAENHLKTVRALAGKPSGLTRQEIIDQCGLSSGGRTTEMLDELEQSGFIQALVPYEKMTKDAVYRLTDEYSLFYLRFMDKRGTKQDWARISEGNTYRVWCGMAYEAVCLKHIAQLKNALGLKGKETLEGTWRFVPAKGADAKGAQIDLLIDRSDHTINICEIKFYAEELTIDKAYAAELRQKLDVFREKVRTRKTLFLTLITTYGVKENIHFNSLVQQSLDMNALFTD